MDKPVIVGAVLYDPKVSVIWDIIRDFFEHQGVPMDVVFYTNYELMVHALGREHIHMAWNSPLAWIESDRQMKCRAVAMRDTDRDRVSHVIVKKSAAIEAVGGLEGQVVAAGAVDSPQAHLIPVEHLMNLGIDFEVKRFDLLVGKHGDHVGGELEAFRCLERGDAAASCVMDLNWSAWTADGTVNADEYRILTTTEPYDHCVFTVREDFDRGTEKRWLDALFSMSYDNPKHRQMMDMEGLKKWEPGRTSGFGPQRRAVERLGFFNR